MWRRCASTRRPSGPPQARGKQGSHALLVDAAHHLAHQLALVHHVLQPCSRAAGWLVGVTQVSPCAKHNLAQASAHKSPPCWQPCRAQRCRPPVQGGSAPCGSWSSPPASHVSSTAGMGCGSWPPAGGTRMGGHRGSRRSDVSTVAAAQGAWRRGLNAPTSPKETPEPTGKINKKTRRTRDVQVHHALPVVGHHLLRRLDRPPLHALRAAGGQFAGCRLQHGRPGNQACSAPVTARTSHNAWAASCSSGGGGRAAPG